MPETEPKVTLQVTYHLQINKDIQNDAKDLKWSTKESLRKSNCGLKLLLKDTAICLTGMQIPSNF